MSETRKTAGVESGYVPFHAPEGVMVGPAEPEWRRSKSVPVPVPARATRVASWIGWHIVEITGVSVPAVVAVAATPWAWVVSGVVGAGWTVQKIRHRREQAAIRAGRDLPPATATATGSGSGESAAGDEVGGAVADGVVVDEPGTAGTGEDTDTDSGTESGAGAGRAAAGGAR